MDKTYHPQTIEKRWSQFWEEKELAKPSMQGNPYCIMLPPPNVTGTLHMGHGFQHTLMDALIRHARMQGYNTLWQAGTDHAGIATQMVVERQLAKENKSRYDLGRDAFIRKVWEWRHESGNIITRQIRRMGQSLDWERECFSMDERVSRATYAAFIKLYEEGLIYRGKRLVNWDPALHTAISDLEVENKQQQGHLWYIHYPLSDGSGHLTVATTRPETMLGDTAVAVHPDDERYQNLIGKTITLPLSQREIPIIADAQVDREFGTGCVKITPAHDFNDYEMGKRHQLPMINILTFDAHLNENTPKSYQGMERFAARKQIIADLKSQGLLEKEEPHTLSIPYGDRSGAVIEPMLTDQWFIKAEPLAKPAMEVVKNGKLKFVPHNWTKIYLQWLENIQDWCISRQLWWGHRIPVWYDNHGHHYVGMNELEVRSKHHLDKNIPLHQDEDVLDTWFTASLWPFSSLGWPEQTLDLKTFYPTDVLITGFDIIFFWVARMVMMGLKLMGDVPFKEVYITGLIRDSQGQKMSKTKGNVLDPLDLIDGIDLKTLVEKRVSGLMQPQMAPKIEKATQKEFPEGIAAYGTDALRFTFCALATTGRDINFDMGRIEGYRNFCNKLWNATRYVLINTEEHKLAATQSAKSLADEWILSRLQHVMLEAEQHFKHYRFDLLTQTLYEFIWNEYCDWYLELSKVVLNNNEASETEKATTRHTLVFVLENILRLLHPIMPFITEEIWQKIAPMLDIKAESIMLAPYPECNNALINDDAESHIKWLKDVIISIRTIRSEMNVSPGKQISIVFAKGDTTDHACVKAASNYIKTLARVDKISWHNENEKLPASATAIVGKLEIHIPLAGLIDKEGELARLQKEISKLNKEYEKSSHKLNNPSYVEKAPPEVVTKERDRLEQLAHTLEKLKEQQVKIERLN